VREKIILAGENGLSLYYNNGILDSSFSNDGNQSNSFRIVLVLYKVAGTVNNDFAVPGYNINGSIDNTFSGDDPYYYCLTTQPISKARPSSATAKDLNSPLRIALSPNPAHNTLHIYLMENNRISNQ
jgi:hypothetical protein